MDLDNDIIALVRAGDPASMRTAIAKIKATHGVSETTAYAVYVRTVASEGAGTRSNITVMRRSSPMPQQSGSLDATQSAGMVGAAGIEPATTSL